MRKKAFAPDNAATLLIDHQLGTISWTHSHDTNLVRQNAHLDRKSSASIQRAIGRLEGSNGGFAIVYRAELKRFGIDVVVAPAGNMKTSCPAKTAAALTRIAERMTSEQRELYGHTFEPSRRLQQHAEQRPRFARRRRAR